MQKDLSKLHKIELREVWKHEALEFTKWLAEEENIALLSEEIGIDIKTIQVEADVGRFNVDILAEEENTNKKIVIENQLEETNHDHLGKIITYASGYDADIVIWVVKNSREEHKKAVEWLNEKTDENTNFFLINIELWKIGDSKPAPKFDIVVSPNEWAKILKAKATSRDLTDTRLQQLDFWTNFNLYVENQKIKLKLRKPNPQHWYNISFGTSDAHITLTLNTRDSTIGCEIYIPDNKDLFYFLSDNASQIEQELDQKLEWREANKASRIIAKVKVQNLFDDQNIEKHYEWMVANINLFTKVFRKHIKNFKKIS